jgi:hypothetical protein
MQIPPPAPLNSSPPAIISPPEQPKPSLLQDITSSIGDLGGGLVQGAVSMITGSSPKFAALLAAQNQMQQELQVNSMLSNISRSRHEAEMAIVRNIRGG